MELIFILICSKLRSLMIVCSCRLLSDREIRTAVLSGATSLDDLGRRLGAGTGCGGCLPTLEDLLEEAQEQRAASPISADSPHEIALAAS